MGIFARLLDIFKREAIPESAAEDYDVLARKIVPELYSGFVEAVARELRSGKVLDVGTGPGYVPIEIAKRAEGVFVEGIDLTRKLIKIAERNANEAGLSGKIHFEVGNATNMRFEDNSYDMVISTGAMHHWKYPARVIDEMCRVLRPGGEAWVLDPNKECSKEDWEEFLERIIHLSGVGFFGRLWLRLGVWKEVKVDCYSRAEIEEMVRASSFSSCDIQIDGVFMTIRLKK